MKFVLISKDAMCTDYLPVYGNKYWSTPNIDELASKGTVFKRHYTAAPSTVMSFFSAITGKYAHETPYDVYEKRQTVYEGETLFSKLKEMGITSHIVWDDMWMVLPKYFDCYRDDVVIHPQKGLRQGVGSHYSHKGFLKPDDEKFKRTFKMIENQVKEIAENNDNIFLWIHFPHVINGRVCYGSDIDLFDEFVGMIRKYFTDDNIAITADHGNMNGHRGNICYGYHVYEPAIRIPLITPRIDGIAEYTGLTSNVDLTDIILNKVIPQHTEVYSDTAYKSQLHRKTAIVEEKYKYIYNKKAKTEELYDLEYDPNEGFNIIDDYIVDPDRKIKAPSREYYYYPLWDELPKVREHFRDIKSKIWKKGSPYYELREHIKKMIVPIRDVLRRMKNKI